MKAMIVIADTTGRLGNRLSIFAHFIAFAIEYNITVVNPAFYDYTEFFQESSKFFICSYPPKATIFALLKENSIIKKVFYYTIYYIVAFMKKSEVESKYIRTYKIEARGRLFLDDPEFLLSINQKQIICFRGWLLGCRFLDQSKFFRHAAAVRSYFTPAEKYQRNVENLIKKIRDSSEIIVGVHIRQGDYKEYLKGRYFYTMEEYVQIMHQVEKLLPEKKVAFLVCSDERSDEKIFAKLDVTFANDHILEDMYSLAKCDYILGPPSSYSVWASFYGNVPLYKIMNPDKAITLDDFNVYGIPLIWKD